MNMEPQRVWGLRSGVSSPADGQLVAATKQEANKYASKRQGRRRVLANVNMDVKFRHKFRVIEICFAFFVPDK